MTQPVQPVVFKPEIYRRKPFNIEAVQLTAENVTAVAEWCGGIVRNGTNPVNKEAGVTPHIKIEVKHALNDRQTRAYPGDWVLRAGGGFKIYTPLSFNAAFEKVEVDRMITVVGRMMDREQEAEDALEEQLDSTKEDTLPTGGRDSWITPGY